MSAKTVTAAEQKTRERLRDAMEEGASKLFELNQAVELLKERYLRHETKLARKYVLRSHGKDESEQDSIDVFGNILRAEKAPKAKASPK